MRNDLRGETLGTVHRMLPSRDIYAYGYPCVWARSRARTRWVKVGEKGDIEGLMFGRMGWTPSPGQDPCSRRRNVSAPLGYPAPTLTRFAPRFVLLG